jgi:hypothetical protein
MRSRNSRTDFFGSNTMQQRKSLMQWPWFRRRWIISPKMFLRDKHGESSEERSHYARARRSEAAVHVRKTRGRSHRYGGAASADMQRLPGTFRGFQTADPQRYPSSGDADHESPSAELDCPNERKEDGLTRRFDFISSAI